jgi:hypothetical protein
MKPSAAMPQEANFSLIGHFGNCPLVVRMTSVRPVIRGRRMRAWASWTGRPGAAGRGAISASGLGAGLDDLLLDEGKVPGQGAGTQLHGDAVGLLQREIAGDLDRAAGDGLADHGG